MRALTTIAITFALVAAAATAPAQDLTADEQRMVDLVNAARADAGLDPLTPDPAIAGVARSHSLDMARNRFFAHESPTTGNMGDRLRAADVPYRRAGENIAYDANVDAAHQAFMNSDHHRANVLNPEYTHIGAGIVRLGDRILVTQAFMLARGEAEEEPAPPPPAAAPETPAATPAGPASAEDQAPEPAGPTVSPAAPGAAEVAPARPAVPSPFALLGMLDRARRAATAGAEAPSTPTLPAPQRPQQPAESSTAEPSQAPPPGVYIVTDDGSWHRIELGPDVLLRLLSAN